MATGNVADGVRHGQHGQTERKSDPQESDAQVGKCRRQHGAAASPENQPERSDEFRHGPLCQWHTCALLSPAESYHQKTR